MAQSANNPIREQVNLLLPSPLDSPELRAGLASANRAERSEAVAEIENLETLSEESNTATVREIVARLSGAGVAGVMSTGARASASDDTGSEPPGYLSMEDLDPRIGPPDDRAIYNPYTNVVTVPAPEDAAAEEAVSTVHSAVSDLVDEAEPAVVHRSLAAMDRSLRVEPEIFDAEADPMDYDSEEMEEAWLEAALEEGLAAEITPWGVNQARAPAAWRRGVFGQGVAVAVVDTGIAPHVDLRRPVRGATFITGSNSYFDDQGHGTHVAGTIAALRGNGRGVVGVAPRVDLIAVKVLARDGYSRGDSVALGITWAANNGARVINLSLGSGSPSASVNRAVTYANSRHVVVCAAAGNDYGGPVSFPAAFRDICIAVAATDRSNRRAVFSNVGPQLDLSAPGVEIQSTYLSNGYRELQGTSMATPHVAAVAALVLNRYPSLRPSDVKRHLERTALPLGASTQYGRGLVQADRAVGREVLQDRLGAKEAGRQRDDGDAMGAEVRCLGHGESDDSGLGDVVDHYEAPGETTAAASRTGGRSPKTERGRQR
jgi:hypothetical protein